MKNTFRYSLAFEDYINFEKFSFRLRKVGFSVFLFIMLATGYLVYNIVKNGNISWEYYLYYAVVVVILLGFYFYSTYLAPKVKAKKYTRDKAYFGQSEISIDEKAVEIKNITEENQAEIDCIYPYSVINAIYETETYFYFIIGNEVKILPKSAVPNEMKEIVFKYIKGNQNCIFVK